MPTRLDVAAAVVDGELVPGDVEVADGRVVAVGCSPPGRTGTALPGFVDLQVNGIADVDLTRADRDGHQEAAAALAATGVTAHLPTIPTAEPAAYAPAVAAAGEAAAAAPVGSQVLGVHLEGPFLSPARAGAHPRSLLRHPDLGLLAGLVRGSPGSRPPAGAVRLVTLAPELPGAVEAIRWLVARGVVVALGHSDATAAEAHAAVDAGASAATHLWNATGPVTARHPGVVGVALTRPEVTVCAIADLVHVAPEVLALTLGAARGRAAVVSDAVAPAGLGDGPHRFGAQDVDVADGAVRLADGTLAGSVGTLDRSLRNLVGLGLGLAEVADLLAGAPARLLGEGDRGTLRPGARADVAVVGDDLAVRRTLVAGSVVHDAG